MTSAGALRPRLAGRFPRRRLTNWQGRSALQYVPHHGALLAHARSAHHRAQPSHRQHRRHHRDGHGLSRLRLADVEELRHHRRNPQDRTARTRPGSARTITSPTGNPVRPGRLTSGRPVWASSISTASSAATPTSGIRPSSTAPTPSRRRTTRSITWTRTWPTTPSRGFTSSTRSRRTSPSSPTTRRASATRRTTRRRNGSRSSRASSTRAGTSCARKRSRGRSQLGIVPRRQRADPAAQGISRHGIP